MEQHVFINHIFLSLWGWGGGSRCSWAWIRWWRWFQQCVGGLCHETAVDMFHLAVRRPRLSLCFDRSSLLPKRRLAPALSAGAAQTRLAAAPQKPDLSLADLWSVAEPCENVGKH